MPCTTRISIHTCRFGTKYHQFYNRDIVVKKLVLLMVQLIIISIFGRDSWSIAMKNSSRSVVESHSVYDGSANRQYCFCSCYSSSLFLSYFIVPWFVRWTWPWNHPFCRDRFRPPRRHTRHWIRSFRRDWSIHIVDHLGNWPPAGIWRWGGQYLRQRVSGPGQKIFKK